MSRQLSIYLAGYIHGERIKECSEWRDRIKAHYTYRDTKNIRILDPLHGKNTSTITPDGLKSDMPARAVLQRDMLSVQEADLIIANMDRFGEERVSVGTIMEIAWGFVFAKPIIIITDEQQYTEHPFLFSMKSALYDSVDDMLNSGIIDYFSDGVQHSTVKPKD